jgi:hypothetical protein
VFVVDPEGLALRRLWCLFEGWMSVVLRGSNSLEVLPHIASRLSRLEAIKHRRLQMVRRRFVFVWRVQMVCDSLQLEELDSMGHAVNAATAHCTHPEHAQALRGLLEMDRYPGATAELNRSIRYFPEPTLRFVCLRSTRASLDCILCTSVPGLRSPSAGAIAAMGWFAGSRVRWSTSIDRGVRRSV